MTSSFRTGSRSLVVVAETGERFSDFGHYVGSIDEDGSVAFQASLRGGGSGVYVGDGGEPTALAESFAGSFTEVCSHPDRGGGDSSFYAVTERGEREVFRAGGGEIVAVAERAGPLGPTMNEAGAFAFRAECGAGRSGISTERAGHVTTIAETGDRFTCFHGLPVVDAAGGVTFRADLARGEGIYVGDGERLEVVVETGDVFASLGHFPFRNGRGAVGFCATLRTEAAGVYVVSAGEVSTIIESDDAFDSFRGVLLDDAGTAVFYATPHGGSLGIFTGPDPVADCLLAVGTPLFGSTVVNFALNPVSINGSGQLAIRARLADERQFILRADPQAG